MNNTYLTEIFFSYLKDEAVSETDILIAFQKCDQINSDRMQGITGEGLTSYFFNFDSNNTMKVSHNFYELRDIWEYYCEYLSEPDYKGFNNYRPNFVDVYIKAEVIWQTNIKNHLIAELAKDELLSFEGFLNFIKSLPNVNYIQLHCNTKILVKATSDLLLHPVAELVIYNELLQLFIKHGIVLITTAENSNYVIYFNNKMWSCPTESFKMRKLNHLFHYLNK